MSGIRTQEYLNFKVKNQVRVNKYLNIVLWFFVITGPAIASGIKAGIFNDIEYKTCLIISLVVIALAGIHLIMLKKIPNAPITAVFALTALDSLIVYMSYNHVSIFLTWFLVPLLSLLFCDRYFFAYSAVLNYVLMCITTWLTAPYEASFRTDYESVSAYYKDVISGFTIESVIMLSGGLIILKLITDYFKELFRQYEQICINRQQMDEKMKILDSMAEIYDNVNLINFIDNTEMALRDPEMKKHGIDMNTQTHTLMNQKIKNQVMPDQLDEFLTFTNITTVRSRLSQKKLISADFIDVVSGWFRAQYITVDATLDGIPNVVIYTTRNVDEEKRREEHLIRLSMTDEMTRLYNRRCYDEDLAEFRNTSLDEDFVLFSIDLNGLKIVNDTKGHAAGDELIKGCADCLALTLRQKGKVYRTGGDEFMAIIHTADPGKLREMIGEKAAEWHGIYSDQITMSIGYAAARDYCNATVDELERLADANMYAEKEKYYRQKGIDRRKS